MGMFVVGVKLWRDGVFDSFQIKHVSAVQMGDKTWMLAHRTPSSPSDIATDTEPREAIQVLLSDAKADEPDTLMTPPNSTPL